ncbi:MAG TPA: DUF937 domain-containing protein [Longimicrobiales bacterium]|nr:DUF937 domain-containing protein [Longimicrobiales bacterium]
MNILESVMGASNGGAVQKLAQQFGLPPDKATAAIGALMPAVAAGLKRNIATDTDASRLTSALASGRHESYLDQPELLADTATTTDGNAILGHIFGDKEVSRQVATGAAQKTGIDPAILKKMLPLVAAIAMGALAKQTKNAGAGTGAGTTAASKGGIGAMLEPLLDRDRDGSAMDDVAGMIGGILGRKAR